MEKREIGLFVFIGIPILLYLITSLRYTIALRKLKQYDYGIVSYILIWLIPFFYILFLKTMNGPISSWPLTKKEEENKKREEENKKRKESKRLYSVLQKGIPKERETAAFYLAASKDQEDKRFITTFLQDENMIVAGYAIVAAVDCNFNIEKQSDQVREIILYILNNPDSNDVYLRMCLLNYVGSFKMHEAIVPIQRLLLRPNLHPSEIRTLVETLAKIATVNAIECIEQTFHKLSSTYSDLSFALDSFVESLFEAGHHDGIIKGLSIYGEKSFERVEVTKLIIDIADERVFPGLVQFSNSEVHSVCPYEDDLLSAIQVMKTILERKITLVRNVDLETIILWPDFLSAIETNRPDPYPHVFDEMVHFTQVSLLELKHIANTEIQRRKHN